MIPLGWRCDACGQWNLEPRPVACPANCYNGLQRLPGGKCPKYGIPTTIAAVDWSAHGVELPLACGHRGRGNQTYTYNVGEGFHCLECRPKCPTCHGTGQIQPPAVCECGHERGEQP